MAGQGTRLPGPFKGWTASLSSDTGLAGCTVQQQVCVCVSLSVSPLASSRPLALLAVVPAQMSLAAEASRRPCAASVQSCTSSAHGVYTVGH